MEKIKCPFCAEEILSDAKKCKHCGEWLKENVRLGGESMDKGTAEARAVTRGLKEKARHDAIRTLFFIINILISLLFWGATNWGVGVTVFIVGWILIDRWYWRE